MRAELIHIDRFEKQLAITLPWESVGEEYDRLVERYARVPVRGFRAGKTPAGVVESLFRNQLRDDLAAVCSKRFCRQALEEHGIEASSPLEITEITLDKERSLAFVASFACVPAFEVPDYANLALGESEEGMLDEISEQLLSLTALELPPRLVEDELRFSEDKDTGAAAQRVKLMLIIKKIAAAEGVSVDARDMDARIGVLARDNAMKPAEVRSFLASNGGLDRLADTLLAEQVLHYLIDKNRKS